MTALFDTYLDTSMLSFVFQVGRGKGIEASHTFVHIGKIGAEAADRF